MVILKVYRVVLDTGVAMVLLKGRSNSYGLAFPSELDPSVGKSNTEQCSIVLNDGDGKPFICV